MKTTEQVKQEALQAMHLMKLSNKCIDAFKTNGEVWTSDGGWAHKNSDIEKRVKEVEEKYGILVFHVEQQEFRFGNCLSMFYISYEDEDDFSEIIDDLNSGYAYCYVENLTYPECSEFGSVKFTPYAGGVVRLG